ncbi:hypothetical protein [Amycolatopsis sp. 195334CR]|uniref:hypothetical protein n=1 Tax=Amycolatopsis sp. 195334CR TaxID=2814588 RepID=UPI001A8C86B8|nr:hypothetical protein [Amycolatopsis sp. 195334CR]MBN6040459.1 hypothetical protein [Amycolatopsis sp. 195334CR]
MRSILRSRAARAMAGRLSWGLGDQAVSSLTNFAVGLYVARSLGTSAFGMFSLAWVSYGVVLNLSRGLGTDPLMVRFSGVSADAWRGATRQATGTALTAGLAASAVSVGAGLLVGGSPGKAFVALGVVIPALLLQDAWRFAFFAAGHGRKAFVNDVVWGVALIPALYLAKEHDTSAAFILAWGLSGAVAAAYGCLQAGVRPDPRGALDWLKRHRDLGTRYLIENVSNSGSAQLRMYGLGAIAGLASVGAVRGAELLLGPFLALLMGLSLVTVAESARVLQRAPHRLRHFCAVLGAGQSAAALLWGLALLLIPDGAGRFVLGDVWAPASSLIVPVTIGIAAAGFTTGAAAGLRALGAAKRSLRAQLIASAAYVGFGLIGAFLAGAPGSAWGVALAVTSGSAVWWHQLHTALKERRTSEKEEMGTS